jgi:hypothetical protein
MSRATTYAGTRYRSRLEARWAIFFSGLNVQAVYEPERFDLGQFQYCPDFEVPAWRAYIEIKPDLPNLAECEKARRLSDVKQCTVFMLCGAPANGQYRAFEWRKGRAIIGEAYETPNDPATWDKINFTDCRYCDRIAACFVEFYEDGPMPHSTAWSLTDCGEPSRAKCTDGFPLLNTGLTEAAYEEALSIDLVSEATFWEVVHLLQAGHAKPDHGPIKTLNRLFRKHLKNYFPGLKARVPWLYEGNVVATLERRSMEALTDLQKTKSTRRPRFTGDPVVIVRYRDEDFLIDGNSRVRWWIDYRHKNKKPAFVLTVQEPAPTV